MHLATHKPTSLHILMNNTQLSKFLSYVLRHNPDSIGLTLDAQGWAAVEELMTCAQNDGKNFTIDQLHDVVETNNKQRFRFSSDRQRICANQGHSIQIDLGLEPIQPPEVLYHGTATRFLDSIQKEGLQPRNRHHVHLSQDVETATNVGNRHGKVVILKVASGQMHADGHQFFCSENGVWLTDHVHPDYFEAMPA